MSTDTSPEAIASRLRERLKLKYSASVREDIVTVPSGLVGDTAAALEALARENAERKGLVITTIRRLAELAEPGSDGTLVAKALLRAEAAEARLAEVEAERDILVRADRKKFERLIKEQDKLTAARARIAELEEGLAECADDLESYVTNEHSHAMDYPHVRAKYERDMEPVVRARSLINGGKDE